MKPFPKLPNPSPDFSGRNFVERKAKEAFSRIAKLWQPSGEENETTHSTVSRYALSLIDRITGKAYSADEIMVPVIVRTTAEGAPINAVKNFYETANGGGGNKDIRFEQVDNGSAPTVVLSLGGISTPLSVEVSSRTITVTCPTAIGQITTTAAAVISAINANGAASSILTASNKTGSNGSEAMALSVGPWVLSGGSSGTEAMAVGQLCRVGDSSPYSWYQWDGTTWVSETVSIADGSLTIAKTSGLQTALDGKASATQGAKADSALQASSIKGVVVTKADGTRTAYPPSADTDAARGLALEAAMAAAVAGDTIDLSPGNYDVAKATSTVIAVATHYAVLAGMTIRLNGARLYHQAAFNGAVFFGADAVDGWSILGPGIIEGTAATSSGANEVGINTRTGRRWLIHGVTVRYFKNTGIQANSSSYTSGDYSTAKVSTGRIIGCNMDLNNIGFANYAGSEYIVLIGCTFNKNLTACDIYAGNTRFLGCEANYNTNYALRIRDGGNDGHGIWNGGSINHNTGFAVAVEANMDNGFTFTGAHLYADTATSNKIQSLGGGLTFVGCIIDSPFYASATPSGVNSVIGSHFPISVVGAVNAVADLSSAERLKWVFENNYSLTGGYANNDTQVYVFADNTAALAGGLTAGRRYRQTTTNLIAEVV